MFDAAGDRRLGLPAPQTQLAQLGAVALAHKMARIAWQRMVTGKIRQLSEIASSRRASQ